MMQQKVKTTRAPRLRLDKNRRLTPMQIYCWATVACLAVLLLALLASRGTKSICVKLTEMNSMIIYIIYV